MRIHGGVVVREVRPRSGRMWAWLMLLVGLAVSIALSVGYAYLRLEGATEDWSPTAWAVPWAVAWAVLVPLMLFIVVKGVTVIAWPRQRKWLLWRFAGALPVAALAGYASWSHISGLLASIGEDSLVCVMATLAVDGLMFVGAGGLLVTSAARVTMPTSSPGPAGVSTYRSSASGAASGSESRSRLFTPANVNVS